MASPPPPGYANSEEKTWALVAHFGGAAGMFVLGAVFGWVAPLIALLAKGNQSADRACARGQRAQLPDHLVDRRR